MLHLNHILLEGAACSWEYGANSLYFSSSLYVLPMCLTFRMQANPIWNHKNWLNKWKLTLFFSFLFFFLLPRFSQMKDTISPQPRVNTTCYTRCSPSTGAALMKSRLWTQRHLKKTTNAWSLLWWHSQVKSGTNAVMSQRSLAVFSWRAAIRKSAPRALVTDSMTGPAGCFQGCNDSVVGLNRC